MKHSQIRLCLVLHNHQPVGNFDDVFQAAYQDSYLPFLNVWEPYQDIKISLHISGPLAKWLHIRHPEYLARIRELVSADRIEIIGGAFYEPILTMIPSRDRVGQITQYSRWLEQRFGGPINGIWIPERVWESALTADISQAGIQYTVLDDFHFHRAGLNDQQLDGYYITEDQGHTLRVFPGSERLRYMIPFSEPQETIEYCQKLAEKHPGSVVVFGDDGEKFGTWPTTKEHVYENGWLTRFFDALNDNRDWLITSTLAEAVASTPPRGRIYLPDASYREMTEWALPVERQIEFETITQQLKDDPNWIQIRSFFGGGFWRNFKVKYPEANEMYARMMFVSSLLDKSVQDGGSEQVIATARDHLYQGQCNCAYWHGAFGGIYLPHLRNAVYHHLIVAENLLEQSKRGKEPWIEATNDDYDFDGRNEIRLANEQMIVWVSPHKGGQIYELDLRKIGHNLLATLQRRAEAYHEKVRHAPHKGGGSAASIHDRIVLKQEGLEKSLNYDDRPRKSLIDHFWDDEVELHSIANSTAVERGDFADGSYQTTVRRNPERVQIMLTCQGHAAGIPLSITKGVTLSTGSEQIEIAYLIEGLPPDRQMHFGVEFNFAGMPDGADDRFFSDSKGQMLGQLGTRLNLHQSSQLHLTDAWLGLTVGLEFDQPGGIWTFPIQSVSQSEAGVELVHQSVVVQPHWLIRGDQNGRWAVRMYLSFQTQSSDNRQNHDQLMVTS